MKLARLAVLARIAMLARNATLGCPTILFFASAPRPFLLQVGIRRQKKR